MSFKSGWSVAYTICHAPVQMTLQIYHHSNYDVNLMSSDAIGTAICHGLRKIFDNSVVAMVTDI